MEDMRLLFKIEHKAKIKQDFTQKEKMSTAFYDGYEDVEDYEYTFIDVLDNEEKAIERIIEIEKFCPSKKWFLPNVEIDYYGFKGYFYCTYAKYSPSYKSGEEPNFIVLNKKESDASLLFEALMRSNHPKTAFIFENYFSSKLSMIDPYFNAVVKYVATISEPIYNKHKLQYTLRFVVTKNISIKFREIIGKYLQEHNLEELEIDKEYYFKLNEKTLTECIEQQTLNYRSLSED